MREVEAGESILDKQIMMIYLLTDLYILMVYLASLIVGVVSRVYLSLTQVLVLSPRC